VDSSGREVSSGRNGTVPGFDDAYIPHTREVENLEYLENGDVKKLSANKYPFMLHSECNAINFATDPKRLIGATLYCTHMPCSKCALPIALHKIKRVVIPEANNMAKCVDENDENITKFIFAQSGIVLQVGEKTIQLNKVTYPLPGTTFTPFEVIPIP